MKFSPWVIATDQVRSISRCWWWLSDVTCNTTSKKLILATTWALLCINYISVNCWPPGSAASSPDDAVSCELRCARRRSYWASATSWRFVCQSCGRTSPFSPSKCVGRCRAPSHLPSLPVSTSHPTLHRLPLTRAHLSLGHLCHNRVKLHVCLMWVQVRV